MLQEIISSKHFTELLAEESMEPRGEVRADLRMGILASIVATLGSTKKKRYKPSDFMPDFKGKAQTGREKGVEMGQIFAAFAKAHNEALRKKRARQGKA